MSEYANQIFSRNFNSLSIDELYNDFLVIKSERFNNYIKKLDISCLGTSYKDSLEDWNLHYKKQTLFIKDRRKHYFESWVEILAIVNYIVKVTSLHFKYSQKNSNSIYCPLKSAKNTLKFLNSLECEIKEMCIALYHGGTRWSEFLN